MSNQLSFEEYTEMERTILNQMHNFESMADTDIQHKKDYYNNLVRVYKNVYDTLVVYWNITK